MTTVTLDTISCKFPESWNECTKKQLLEIAPMLFSKKLKLNQSEWNVIVIMKLINPSFFNFRFINKFLKTPRDMVVQVFYSLIEFIKEGNSLTEFKVKRIRVGFKKLYAPKDGLANIVINEFRFLDELYIKYKKTGDVDFLDAMVGILYREKSKDYNPNSTDYRGDIRERFNEHQIIRNANRVGSVSLAEKLVIYLSYEGSRNKIIANHPHLFKNEEVKQPGKSFGYGGLILEMAGTKFGSFEQTCQTNLTIAFSFLEMEAINSEKLKQK